MFKTIFLISTLSFIVLSCKQKTKSSVTKKEIAVINSKDQTLSTNENWIDSLIINYLYKTDNKLIKSALKDTIPEEWLYDDEEKTDSAIYLIFHIGHNVSDKNGTNKRFVTDGWVYIDSLKRKLYEYDLPSDSLIEWKK